MEHERLGDNPESERHFKEWADALRLAARLEVAADRYFQRETEEKYSHVDFEAPYDVRSADPDGQLEWLNTSFEEKLREDSEDAEYARLWYQLGIETLQLLPMDVRVFARRYYEDEAFRQEYTGMDPG